MNFKNSWNRMVFGKWKQHHTIYPPMVWQRDISVSNEVHAVGGSIELMVFLFFFTGIELHHTPLQAFPQQRTLMYKRPQRTHLDLLHSNIQIQVSHSQSKQKHSWSVLINYLTQHSTQVNDLSYYHWKTGKIQIYNRFIHTHTLD